MPPLVYGTGFLFFCSLLTCFLQGLTAGVSPEVLESMRLLVQTVMGGMGNRYALSPYVVPGIV